MSTSKLKKQKQKKINFLVFLFLKKENNASKSQPRTLILSSLQTIPTLILSSLQTIPSQNLEIQLIH